jgi:PAS domain S-box-containing protein
MTRASILIVEEDGAAAVALKSKLHDLGYDVVGAVERGDHAVRLARAFRPSLALVSITLQQGMDGIDAARFVGLRLGIPVVFLVRAGDEEAIRRAESTSPYGYLVRPAGHKELFVAVEIALHKVLLEYQLRQSERWFASTLRCVGDGIVVTGDNGRIHILNAAAENLTGWRLDQAVGHDFNEVVTFATGEAPNRFQCSARQAVDKDCVVGFNRGRKLRTRLGRESLIDEAAAPYRHEHGRRSGAVVILRRVGNRVRVEQLLQARKEQFHRDFNATPQGMALISLDGIFLEVNEALARLLGYDSHELLGQSQEQITHPADRDAERHNLYEVLTGRSPTLRYEKRYLDRDRMRMSWVEVGVTLLFEAEEPVCFLLRVRELERRLQQR